MGLKNYTTTIPVQKTVSDLQAALVKHGAKSIIIDYADELPVRVNFIYPSKVFGDVHYRVPVDVEAVWRYVFQHGASEGMGPRLRTREQAARIAWRVALALQADGWTLRSEVVWEKKNPMPESVEGWRWQQHRVKTRTAPRVGRVGPPGDTIHHPGQVPHRAGSFDSPHEAEWADCPGCPKCAPNDGLVLRLGAGRPTRAHEQVFLLSNSGTYFYDSTAIAEPAINAGVVVRTNGNEGMDEGYDGNRTRDGFRRGVIVGATRNRRSVWTISTKPTPEAHFATFPPDLVRPMIMASTSEAGCCPHCGSPWARVVERPTGAPTFKPLAIAGSGALPDGPGTHRNLGGRYQKWLDEHPKVTSGWRATCKCPPHEPVPCVVLDIFSGAGTTVIEAVALGRVGIGIDLKPDYHDIAIRRLKKPATAPRRPDARPEPARSPSNGHEPAFRQGSLI